MYGLKDLKVGDKVAYYTSGYAARPTTLESEVIKITKTQIHIKYKNGNCEANGEVYKFNNDNGREIGHKYDMTSSSIAVIIKSMKREAEILEQIERQAEVKEIVGYLNNGSSYVLKGEEIINGIDCYICEPYVGGSTTKIAKVSFVKIES